LKSFELEMSASGPKADIPSCTAHVRFRGESEHRRFSCAGKDQQFFGQASQDAFGDALEERAMKAQRDPIEQPDARGVLFGLFAIIVICAVTWAVAYIW
jgi:hypothetical protein